MEPLSPGWIKINSDGTTERHKEWAETAGVLRDSNWRWIDGYQRFVRRGSTLVSKLWAIFHGLQVANL